MPAGYEQQMPEGSDQSAQMRDAFAQLLMQQQMQQGQGQGGLPPFNGKGEGPLQSAAPPQAAPMMPTMPQAGAAQQQQGSLGVPPSPQDLQVLQQLMQQQQQAPQRQSPGAFSLPQSPGAGRFNI